MTDAIGTERAPAPGGVAGHEGGVEILARTFARLDPMALGVACGVVLGGAIFFATAWLLVKGGPVVGPTLSLLSNYFPGFRVTWPGALLGLLYGAAAGFLLGWAAAGLRNLAADLFLRYAKARSEREARRRFLDYV